jgi:hypothetical protein
MDHKYTTKLFIIQFSGGPRPGLSRGGSCISREILIMANSPQLKFFVQGQPVSGGCALGGVARSRAHGGCCLVGSAWGDAAWSGVHVGVARSRAHGTMLPGRRRMGRGFAWTGFAGLTAGSVTLYGKAVGDRPRQRHLIGVLQLPAKRDPPGNRSDPQWDIL